MGWGSASGIFNNTIESVIEAGVSGEQLTKIASDLIEQLSADDWDTQSESMEAFQNNRDVLKAFESQGYRLPEHAFKRLEPALAEVLAGMLKNTTPGVWVSKGQNLYLDEGDGSDPTYWAYCDGMSEMDVRFIAYSRMVVPMLLEEIGRLKARLYHRHDDSD